MFRTLTLSLLVVGSLAALPARAAEPDLKPEPVQKSRLVSPTLPEGAKRLNNLEPLGELITALKKAATDGGMVLTNPEALLWNGAGYNEGRGTELRRDLVERLKKAGYNYEVAGETKTDEGLVTLFVAGLPGGKQAVLGSWTTSPSFLLLAWGSIRPKDGPGAAAPAEKPAATAPANPGLLGTWGFTSISGTTYWDKGTGAYLGSGTGGSQSYTFLPGNRYKLFNYVKTRSYGWETQALTWEEGTYTQSGDSLTFTPTSGKYQVIDNSVARNNYTRAMTAEELKKNAKRFDWKMDVDQGKPVLLLGKDASSQVKYRRIEE